MKVVADDGDPSGWTTSSFSRAMSATVGSQRVCSRPTLVSTCTRDGITLVGAPEARLDDGDLHAGGQLVVGGGGDASNCVTRSSSRSAVDILGRATGPPTAAAKRSGVESSSSITPAR
jgi:hypothetical protein